MKTQLHIHTVTVIGANGTMGANVSGIFASFGEAKVYLVSRDMEKSRRAAEKAFKSVRADSISQRLIPVDYSALEQCVGESDLVFESAAENFSIKKELTEKVAKSLRPDAIMCTGTSGLSVTKLAECLPENMRSRYMGMHFFNPPYNMPLCELIPTQYTDPELLEQTKVYLQTVLFRTVAQVKDAPAFLANRIGFQFINEIMQMAQTYQDRGGIDYMDAIFGSFTGRAMAPLTTADFVGLDVHKAIVDNLYENTCDYARETFRLPAFAQKLIDAGKLGRKAGCGFYKMELGEDGKKTLLVYDVATDSYRPKKKYAFTFVKSMSQSLRNGDYQEAFTALLEDETEEAELCRSMLVKYIAYSVAMNRLVGADLYAADAVMAAGFNWCPPVAMANGLSSVADMEQLLKKYVPAQVLEQADVFAVLEEAGVSPYDYRPYFKSAK